MYQTPISSSKAEDIDVRMVYIKKLVYDSPRQLFGNKDSETSEVGLAFVILNCLEHVQCDALFLEVMVFTKHSGTYRIISRNPSSNYVRQNERSFFMKEGRNESKMAFSFRKMFSNISYFKRPEDDPQFHVVENGPMKRRHDSSSDHDKSQNLSYEKTDLDLSNRRYAKTMKKLPDAIKHFTAKKCSLKQTDQPEALDITCDNKYADDVIENTPKQISLGYSSVFSEKFKQIDFNKSFDLFDYMSEGRPSSSDKDLETPWSERSDSELSASEDGVEVKMYEIGKDGDHAENLLTEFQFHIGFPKFSNLNPKITGQLKLQQFQRQQLFSTMLQKSAMERIMFYVQVHSIEMRNDLDDAELSTKTS
ncbi:hypothetical protein EVAR_60701_1 [Eumeta japonica]|uniref:Uncharacterized protein n=1 Tax=Eumeta variegata TaxID=151549 RepID=A0A4C1ZAZ9_EUMVA|nr:hypothetical protein EVAR_60701_1 [Eumeta japonica]